MVAKMMCVRRRRRDVARRVIVSGVAVLLAACRPLPELSTWAEPPRMAATADHTCYVRDATRMVAFCWGANMHAQLGDGSYGSRPGPVRVRHAIATIAAGTGHSCGLSDGRDVFCWGSNSHSVFGLNAAALAASATPVATTHIDPRAAALSAGSIHTCALEIEGSVFCWGDNHLGQVGVGTAQLEYDQPQRLTSLDNIRQISAGVTHTCALRSDHVVLCWGHNQFGQIGNGSTGTVQAVPDVVLGGITFARIAAGEAHTCGIAVTGLAYCWGLGADGRLGNGTVQSRAAPTSLVGRAQPFIAITAGGSHTCALGRTGEAFCWGNGSDGQLGTGRTTIELAPARVATTLRFRDIVAGTAHTCARTLTGDVYCWGVNHLGQLGDGRAPTSSAVPVQVLPH